MQLLGEDKDIEYYQWIITDRKARLLTLTLKIRFFTYHYNLRSFYKT